MRASKDPIGPNNDAAITQAAVIADQIVCAWGTHGAFMQRGAFVKGLLDQTGKPLSHLGLSKDGHPKHPLYIAYSQKPVLWT